MARFAVILPAAGRSSRFAAQGFGLQPRKKPFLELKGRPVWVRAVEPFVNRDDVVQTVIAVAPEDLDWFKEKFRPNLAFMNVEIVPGGAERADTVRAALARIRPEADFVAVHDAARPLIVPEWIDLVFRAAEKSGAAILAVPVAATLKRATEDGTIAETVDRRRLWEAQTPQVFRRTLLLDAYARLDGHAATDEAQAVERIGHPVTLVEGSCMNFKITTQSDFRMAEAVLDVLPKPAGFRPLHPFADEKTTLF